MSELLLPRTPGAMLRTARERKGLTMVEVTDATRIKPHIIASLEMDDYSVISAPLYGKGFIKLYAEYLGLDPAPLVRHYVNYYAREVRPTLKTDIPPPSSVNDGIPQPSTLSRFRTEGSSVVEGVTGTLGDVLSAVRDAVLRLCRTSRAISHTGGRGHRIQNALESMTSGRLAALGFALLVLAVLGASLVYFVSGTVPVAKNEPAKHATFTGSLRSAVPPPAPYIKLR